MASSISLTQLNRATLERQGLITRHAGPVPGVVARLAGLQAQHANSPYVALWSRREGQAISHLEKALEKATVVKATLMRATLHLVDSGEIDEFRRAGMTLLDGSDSRLVIAFADDPQLEAFRERMAAFEAGPPDGQKAEPYAAFLDAVEDLRLLTAEDRISGGLWPVLQQVDPTHRLRLDLVLWHPGNRDVANEWLDEIAAAVTALEGTIVDSSINDEAGVLLARSYLEAGRVMELADGDIAKSCG